MELQPRGYHFMDSAPAMTDQAVSGHEKGMITEEEGTVKDSMIE